MARKIPNEAIDKLLAMARRRLPELRPIAADLVIGLSWDDEGEGEWNVGARVDADAEAIVSGVAGAGAMGGIRRASQIERDGDVFLVVRFR